MAGQPPNEPDGYPWQPYGQGQGEPGWPSYGQPAEDGNARVYPEPGTPYGGPGGPAGPGAPGGPYSDPDATRVQRAVDYPAPGGAQGGYEQASYEQAAYEQANYDLPGGQGQYDPSGAAQGQYDQAADASRAREMRHVSGAKGFVGSLFDFDFTSFVTPKIIKVLYVLIVVVTGLAAIAWTLVDFRVSVAFGLVTLVIIAPLIFFVTIALYRVILEFFAVVFRLAEDIHAIRERGDRLG